MRFLRKENEKLEQLTEVKMSLTKEKKIEMIIFRGYTEASVSVATAKFLLSTRLAEKYYS